MQHLVAIQIKGNQVTLVGTGRSLTFHLAPYTARHRAAGPHVLRIPKAA